MGLIYEEDHRGVCRIGWADEEFGGLAGILGQSNDDGVGVAPKAREDWEHWIACKTVLGLKPKVERDSTGFYWENERDVKAAFRIIEAAMKQKRPLPEWAKTALGEGWTMPKGWKA